MNNKNCYVDLHFSLRAEVQLLLTQLHLGQPQSGIRTLVVYRDFWDAESGGWTPGNMMICFVGAQCCYSYYYWYKLH